MGLTIAQKIFVAHKGNGSLEKGAELGLVVDQCLTQDSTGTMAWLEFEALGLDRVRSENAVSYNDHTSLGFKGESTDDHFFLMSIAKKYGAIYSKPGNGVCHQIQYERFGVPGKTLLGSDSHTPTGGGLGMMAIGAGGMDVAVAMGGGCFYLKVPKIMKVNLTGKLNWGCSAKDMILTLLRQISVKGGVGYIIEYGGEGIKTLSVPERATITNMGAESGATTSIFPSDEITRQFMVRQGREADWVALEADQDAAYDKIIDIDLGEIKPVVAMTGMPDNVFDIAEIPEEEKKLEQVFIGSCTNGGYLDLRRGALMLEGKKVNSDIDLIVSPGSRQVQMMLIEDGSYGIYTRAGARLIDPGCNACIGIGFVPGEGHRSLRTTNRNWPGRGGSAKAKICLASVETCVASAIAGYISDPRQMEAVKVEEPTSYMIEDTLFLTPEKADPGVEVRRSSNIASIRQQVPPADVLEGKVLLKVGDGISTDDILPAGPLTQHLRSNLPKISEFTFYYEDETLAKRAIEAGGGFLVGGDNYGQGSSREHAALGPHQLGIKAVLANNFARIHCANLINVGILPIECDTAGIDKDDELAIDITDLSGKLTVRNVSKGADVPAVVKLSEREKAMIRAGGLLAYTTNN